MIANVFVVHPSPLTVFRARLLRALATQQRRNCGRHKLPSGRGGDITSNSEKQLAMHFLAVERASQMPTMK